MNRLFWLCILLACSAAVDAREWDLQPYLNFEHEYTDNVFASPSPEHDIVTTVNPGFIFSRNGPLLNVTSMYDYFSRSHQEFVSRETSYSNLNIDGTLGSAYYAPGLDGSLQFNQSLTSSSGGASLERVLESNSERISRYYISPYLRTTESSDWDAEMRYWNELTRHERQASLNRDREGFSLKADSPDNMSGFYVGVRFNSSRERFYNVANHVNNYSLSSIRVAFRSLPSFLTYLERGYESNRYSLGGRRLSDQFWMLSTQWYFDQDSLLALSVGERFYGESYEFRFVHRRDVWRVSAQYIESISTTISESVSTTTATPFSSELYVEKSVTIEAGLSFRRFEVSATANKITRLLQLSDSENITYEGNVGLIYTASTLIDVGTYYIGRWMRDGLAERIDRHDILRGEINWMVRPEIQAGLTVERTIRDSSGVESDYRELSIAASVNMQY